MRNKFGSRNEKERRRTLRESQLQHTLAHFSRKGFWRSAKSRQARDFILVGGAPVAPYISRRGPGPRRALHHSKTALWCWNFLHLLFLPNLFTSRIFTPADSRVSWHREDLFALTQGFLYNTHSFCNWVFLVEWNSVTNAG